MVEVQQHRQQTKDLLTVATHNTQRPFGLELVQLIITTNECLQICEQGPAFYQMRDTARGRRGVDKL